MGSRRKLTPREVVAISKALDSKQVSAARAKLSENKTYRGSVTVTFDYSLQVEQSYTQERVTRGVDPWALVHVLQKKLREHEPKHSIKRTINSANRVSAKDPKAVKATRQDFQKAMDREQMTVNCTAPISCTAEVTKV